MMIKEGQYCLGEQREDCGTPWRVYDILDIHPQMLLGISLAFFFSFVYRMLPAIQGNVNVSFLQPLVALDKAKFG